MDGDILHDAMQYLNLHFPRFAKAKTLYHYTRAPLAYTFSRNGCDLYCTNCKELNDRREFLHGIDKIEASIREYNVMPEKNLDELKRIIERLYLTEDAANPWIMSFSLEDDSLSQWNGYTDHFDGGYAFGIDRKILENLTTTGLPNRDVFLLPCIYREKDVAEVLGAFVNGIFKPFLDGFKKSPDQVQYQVRIGSTLFALASILKDPGFACENEVRLVAFTQSRSIKVIGGKHRIGIGIGDAGFGRVSELISEVVVSPHGNTEFLRHIAKSCGFDSSIIRQSKIPYRGW